MVEYFLYILKACACLIIFYLFFIAFLKDRTFFFINRLYLIAGLILSFAIPLLKFSIFENPSEMIFSGILSTSMFETEYDLFQTQNTPDNVKSINYLKIMSVLYFSGILVLFFRLLFSISKVIRIKNNSEIFQMGNYKVYKTDSVLPFSFFKLIFLPKNESQQLIIEHEITHIRQFHWFDLLLTEIANLLLWFNPFVILYKRSLKLQHEYLADQNVIKNNDRMESYFSCMLKQVQVASSVGLTSQFYCKTIKKRIVMMTKNKTSVKYLGVYLLVLPLVGLLLFAFTDTNHSSKAVSNGGLIIEPSECVPSIFPVDAKKVKKMNVYGMMTDPFTKKKVLHKGVDFALPEGEEIYSTAKGVVIEASFDSKKGNYLLVKHDDEYTTFYSHLKSISVEVGDKVNKGQVIGLVGSTGYSTGPHLHYEVHKNGERIDPMDYIPK